MVAAFTTRHVTELLQLSGFYLTDEANRCTLRMLFRCLTEIAKNRRSRVIGLCKATRQLFILSPQTFYRRQ